MKVLVLGGISRSLINFRGPLLQKLTAQGHQVVAASGRDENSDEVAQTLNSWGVEYRRLNFTRASLNPRDGFQTVRSIRRLLEAEGPDIFLAYTAKPVIFGGLAIPKTTGTRFFPMITGLGYAFTHGSGLKRRFVHQALTALYRRALQRAEGVIFQNPDDRALFLERGILGEPDRAHWVNGSGVDLEAFPPKPLPKEPSFLMVARLVADKGVREFVAAARRVRITHPKARFRLAGGLDPNPAGITSKELEAWINEGVIEYLGPVHPIQPELERCRYYVLPSYREGTPRSVLEAMATGRPVITTNTPGCRETVISGQNGLLVPPRDAQGLAEAMIELLESPQETIERMAEASLALAREKFDVHAVNQKLLDIMGL